ncbi:unnamed protein product, partial [Ilex paraguariensis]
LKKPPTIDGPGTINSIKLPSNNQLRKTQRKSTWEAGIRREARKHLESRGKKEQATEQIEVFKKRRKRGEMAKEVTGEGGKMRRLNAREIRQM